MTIHPFDDGNGRIARAIADMAARASENSPQRFYSMSAQIRQERNDYYDILEQTQKGTLDITPWLEWFLGCLGRAIDGAESRLRPSCAKARFWERMRGRALNERQRASAQPAARRLRGQADDVEVGEAREVLARTRRCATFTIWSRWDCCARMKREGAALPTCSPTSKLACGPLDRILESPKKRRRPQRRQQMFCTNGRPRRNAPLI